MSGSLALTIYNGLKAEWHVESIINEVSSLFDGKASVFVPDTHAGRGFLFVSDDLKILAIGDNHQVDSLDSVKTERVSINIEVDRRSYVRLILLSDISKYPSKSEALLTMVQIASVIIKAVRCDALVWHPSGTLLPAKHFMNMTQRWVLEHSKIPILLFCRVDIQHAIDPNGHKVFGISSVGLAPFIGAEIKFHPQVRTMNEILHAFQIVAGEAFCQRALFEDGHVCGKLSGEAIIVSRPHLEQETDFDVYLCEINKTQPPSLY